MANIQICETAHAHWGRLVQLTNGVIEAMVTVDVGPRVIHFATVGMENMFYQDVEKRPLGEAFPVYGGHRLWTSPEVLPRCYYPDNAPVEWEETENGASFTAPVEKINLIQKSLTLTLSETAPSVVLTHYVENLGNWEVEFAPWSITMMDKGTKAVMPMPERETGVLPNRNIALWPYSDMGDPRVFWGKKYMTLTHNPGLTPPFKLGYNNEAGWAAAFNKGQVFFKFYEPDADGVYPDGGCSYETYVNGDMLEMEALSELTILAPGDAATFVEEWEIYPEGRVPSNDEVELARIMKKYIK